MTDGGGDEVEKEVEGDVGEVAVAGEREPEERAGEAGGVELPGVEGEVDDGEDGEEEKIPHEANVVRIAENGEGAKVGPGSEGRNRGRVVAAEARSVSR